MNIAIFLPNWIGDVVMATPAVRACASLSGRADDLGREALCRRRAWKVALV